jgi:hypothetical protein
LEQEQVQVQGEFGYYFLLQFERRRQEDYKQGQVEERLVEEGRRVEVERKLEEVVKQPQVYNNVTEKHIHDET